MGVSNPCSYIIYDGIKVKMEQIMLLLSVFVGNSDGLVLYCFTVY